MAHLIDKDALVAEIKNRRDGFYSLSKSCEKGTPAKAGFYAQAQTLEGILSLLDTLEVKEVDLKDEIPFQWSKFCLNGKDKDSFVKVAKHFFELGLQAQHDWKVVDNINPPQADRNKIYCVFTKQRYILAKVIDHPQDDGLLQWKCTEFPNHRYDMCEGDKYMQIV